MVSDKLIVLNMKMMMTADQIMNYLKVIDKVNLNRKIVLCPTALFIPYFLRLNCSVGIQDISQYSDGAFTGEISAKQCASIGVSYVILGHSERRLLLKETDEIIIQKIRQALDQHLKVILCIGENKIDHDLSRTNEVIKEQLLNIFNKIPKEQLNNIIVAYEPIWAIGSGIVPTSDYINNAINKVKEIIKEYFDIYITVLYGGGVNIDNINALKKIDKLDGFLIGNASNDPIQFTKILEVVVNQ